MAAKQSPPLSPSPVGNKPIVNIQLDQLDFDIENPRFGSSIDTTRSQTEILDYIVDTFGVDDVLSSIAVNGYFMAEPLICREQVKGNRLTVVEGNRRLAACLILTNDPRAKNQAGKHKHYNDIRRDSKQPEFTTVPVIRFGVHEDEKALLSYLGVRHIAASQGWDSYAKAAWIAKVVERSKLTLQEIALMTGDQHQTVRRLLEGYYFVNQLIEEGHFVPETSLRKGRGSNRAFPFSWIYTLLGYPAAKNFVGMPDQPTKNPVPAERMLNAQTLVVAMFGDKTAGRSASIEDSREIGELASVLSDVEKTSLLEKGVSVAEIKFQSQPIDLKLRDGLADCQSILQSLTTTVVESKPSMEVASNVFPLARKVNNLSLNLARTLQEIQGGLDEA